MFSTTAPLFDEQLRQRLVLTCDAAISANPDQFGPALQEVEDVLMQMMQPPNLRASDPGNAFLAAEASFERACVMLEEKGVSNPGALSLYQFYGRVKYFSEKK